MITVKPYDQSFRDQWNEFAQKAKNSHFLFDRNYMEYHRDRFLDCSLLIFQDRTLQALFPANVSARTCVSHQGLTFGGWLMAPGLKTHRLLEVADATFSHLAAQGITRVVIKLVPWIYRQRHTEADAYVLFRHQAKLIKRDLSAAIDLEMPVQASRRRLRGMRRVSDLMLGQDDDWPGYWRLLNDVLRQRHNVEPVHSLDEITLLSKLFSDNIQLYTARKGDEIVAGVVIYETKTTAHAQYIAASEKGRATAALDGLFGYLIARSKGRVRYFDFGISTEADGCELNFGLAQFKEEFGADGICHDTYEVDI